MTDPNGDDSLLASLNAKLRLAYKEEEEFWRQRSRIMWLSAGDKNSGYFHAIAKGCRARNRMSVLGVLEGSDGKAYFEEDQISGQISSYFDNIFTSDSSGASATTTSDIVSTAISPNISDEANSRLGAIPEATEIRQALFLIHPDKAPGPDGFSARFFHSN